MRNYSVHGRPSRQLPIMPGVGARWQRRELPHSLGGMRDPESTQFGCPGRWVVASES